MRTKNVLRNTGFSLALEILTLAFGLIMPRLVILAYGSNVNGLTSAVNQIISVINLLQAGAVGAAIFEMYGPAAEKDYIKISAIYSSSKKYFNKLGCVFMGIIIASAPLVAWSQSDSGLPSWAVAASVLILGMNAGYSFFFCSCYDIIFSAHQMNFRMSLAGIIEKLTYYGLLFLVIGFRIHFVFMYAAVLLGGTAKVIYLTYEFKRNYGKKLVHTDKSVYYKIRNKGYLLVNQISIQIAESSPFLIISSLCGLGQTSVYSVYNLVQYTLRTIFASVQYSVAASFGNVTVSETREKANSVFNLIHFGFSMMGTFLYTCAAFLFVPFIRLYTHNFSDADYMLPVLALLIIFYSVSWCLCMPYTLAANVYGLFRETSAQAVICGAAAIIISIVAAESGISYVPAGLIFYYLSGFAARLAVIKKKMPWFSFKGLIRRTALLILFPAASFILYEVLKLDIRSWPLWLLTAVLTALAAGGSILLYILMFERSEFEQFLDYFKAIFLRKKKP